MTTTFIGQPVSRVDARQKVTGRATYAAEFNQPASSYAAPSRTAASLPLTARRLNERPASLLCSRTSMRHGSHIDITEGPSTLLSVSGCISSKTIASAIKANRSRS
jgi:hypothetical protein